MNAVIILPTYNESGNIENVVRALDTVFKDIPKHWNMKILVVDDESPDQTANIVRSLMKRYPYLSLIEGKKRGLGAAYIRGMQYAIDKMHADVVFQMDADLQHDPTLVPHFLVEIDKGSDFVIGSRYITGGSIPQNWGLKRKLYSTIGNLVVRWGLIIPSIHDWTSGYRAIRGSVIKNINEGLSKYPGYTFQVALLHRAYMAKAKISEIPLQFTDRSYGKSKIVPPEYIFNVLKFVFTHSTFFKYLQVGGVGFGVQTLISAILVHYINILPGIAVGIGAEAAIISNFVFSNLWTFSHKKLSGRDDLVRKFSKFQMASLGAVVLQSASVWVITHILGASVWFPAMVFSIVFLVIPFNFFVYNRFIWKTHE